MIHASTEKKIPCSGLRPAAVEELHLSDGEIVSVLDQTIHTVLRSETKFRPPPERNRDSEDRVPAFASIRCGI